VVFHATWTDNRDVRPPVAQDWTKYTPTGLNTGGSIFDPSQTVAPCDAKYTGSRNQNIYTSRITDGLFVGAASNTKNLGSVVVNGSAVLLQRAFSVFVQNSTQETKSFRLDISSAQPIGGQASFEQFKLTTTVDVTMGPRTTVSRTVFGTSTDRRAMIVVNVAEISSTGSIVANGLSGSVILNPDRTSPDLVNDPTFGDDITFTEVYNPDITTLPTVITQDIANQDIANQDIANQDIANQDIANPDIANQDIANQDIANQDIANVDLANQDIANQDLANQDLANASISDAIWTIKNDGNTSTSYAIKLLQNVAPPDGFKVQLILSTTNMIPVSRNCTLGFQRQTLIIANIINPIYANPLDLTSTGITDPSKTNATIILAPGQQAKLTVRVVDPDRRDNIKFDTSKGISPVMVAHGVNSADARGGGKRPPITLVITNTMNSLPTGLKSRTYSASLQAIGGVGPYSWRVSEGALPPGLILNSATGVISGKPTERAVTIFTVEARDSASSQHIALRNLKIAVF
jgi:hypothetical protein